jgi:hypothetical protein
MVRSYMRKTYDSDIVKSGDYNSVAIIQKYNNKRKGLIDINITSLYYRNA